MSIIGQQIAAMRKLSYRPSQTEIEAWEKERPKCWNAHLCVTWGCAAGSPYQCRRRRAA